MAEVMIARRGFTTLYDGRQLTVRKGTTVRAGHELLTGREHLFRSIEELVDYDVESPKEKPKAKKEKEAAASEPAAPQAALGEPGGEAEA